MKAYAAQLHLHGSMSEGPASCLAHDHMAAETGYADVLWWTDHDFRVSNFGKLQRSTFTGLLEEVDHPNRTPEALERVVKVPLEWKPVDPVAPVRVAGRANGSATGQPSQPDQSERPRHGLAQPSTAVIFGAGAASLHFVLPPAGPDDPEERRCLYELRMGAHYETFPLLTRPVLRLAIFPGEGVGPHGQVVIALTLSEQPPDLANTRLTYVLGGAPTGNAAAGNVPAGPDTPAAGAVVAAPGEHGTGEATISLPFTPGRWNEYALDPLADVQRLGLRGGADNSLHRLRLGIASPGPTVEAHFGHLEVEVEHRGPAVLDLHRRLLAELPTRVRHHVGLEVSYYGRHVTGFGAGVPIPDYDALLPGGLTTDDVVAHIHRHGGLACLAHPPRVDPETTAVQLAERRLYGADLMEVAHGAAGLADRLRLWDLLARHGLIVTGIGVSDAHSAKVGWTGTGDRPVAWVTRIWAESDDEPDLLDALRRGRVFFADPSAFRGDLSLTGPNDVEMGDVVVTTAAGGAAPPLRARVTGAEPGDLIAWYANGHLIHASALDVISDNTNSAEWQFPAPIDRLQAIRIELRRPRLAAHPFGGLIACSNPIYFTPEPPPTTHRIRHLHTAGAA